jgi:PAS domain S-box-containing protein
MPSNVTQFIAPLFSEGLKQQAGYIEDCHGQPHFAVALKRDGATAWIICSDPADLTELRRRIGIGRLIQDIGRNDEIVFIVVQDKLGILSATKNIENISSLNSDPFLLEAFSDEKIRSRISTFQDAEIFEVVKPLYRSGQIIGLIRIGMSMNSANQAMTRTLYRALAVLFGFVVITVILFSFFASNQNYRLLTDAFAKFRTYTGNILENMADAVVVIDTEERITIFNHAAEKLFNFSAKKAIGSYCEDIIGEQTSLLKKTLTSGIEIRDYEVGYILGSKRVILSATTRIIRNEKGAIESVVAVLKDLTEKKMYEKRLKQNEKLTAMGELASGVAHEIRNPLNAISIIAQRFLHEFKAKSNQNEFRELATAVITATGQVSKVIQRFLEFARPDSINLKICRLNSLIKKAIMLIESQAIAKNISIDVEIGGTIDLNLDEEKIQQVLLNILQNSIQATPQNGQIKVHLYQNDGDAIVKLSDNGHGISDEHIKKIFDLYFTTKDSGTGMGLSISHQIVSQHEGRIEVDSTVGEGTIFKIILPINSARV